MSEDALISRFFGSSNVIWTNGDDWKRQTAILRNAFNTIPVDVFVGLCKNLFEVIESTQTHSLSQPSPSDPLPLYSEKSPHADSSHTVDWSDLSQRLTLDAVGCSIMGYNYDSLRTASPFVTAYNRLMEDIAHPLYLMLPALERILPRKEANARMEKLSRELCELLNAKRKDPGQDIMTFMVNDPELTSKELQDNMTALFLAGHDTTTSVLATLVYYLARHPEIQSKAREEVTRVFASHGVSEPEDISVVTSQSLPYLTACVKETMRIQPPGTYITPRISPGVVLGGQYIPPGVLIVPNIYAIHHSSAIWRDPDVFRPERFTESPSTSASTTGATFGSANGVGSSGREPWLPFSSGPRVCPAHNFSQYELRIIAAMLLLRYEWRLPPGSSHADRLKNAFSSLGMLIPEHLDITFTRRADSVIGR
ncbi:cytochrome P450 [Coniophora puteana RWD-64-598 SS2]|uniref:Cytochrome P450 n=1 Tax=Coniophora puteana (strain RWD-64-598) TaxID=741705 RepID=A0A5M3MEG1_CONPW|nr:cytochrome P450 [Coniophora puteana RWD-64-598 SS2]EIW77437.1 cytochrome P450 [Coniophora puteana RWD-64-598 SS2]